MQVRYEGILRRTTTVLCCTRNPSSVFRAGSITTLPWVHLSFPFMACLLPDAVLDTSDSSLPPYQKIIRNFLPIRFVPPRWLPYRLKIVNPRRLVLRGRGVLAEQGRFLVARLLLDSVLRTWHNARTCYLRLIASRTPARFLYLDWHDEPEALEAATQRHKR